MSKPWALKINQLSIEKQQEVISRWVACQKHISLPVPIHRIDKIKKKKKEKFLFKIEILLKLSISNSSFRNPSRSELDEIGWIDNELREEKREQFWKYVKHLIFNFNS